ncbi:MAG: glycosyltransferase family 39 protein [Anaerolineae bacterium]
MDLLKRHRAAVFILVLFVVLGATYSVVVPIFEAPDEMSHYPFVAHLAQGGGLPVQRAGQQTLWQQEGSQPPLYYALAAALTHWLDVSDLPEIHRINPHARVGIPLAHDNKNIVIHTDREAFPWRGAVLGVHLVRLFSLALAVGTLICTYALSRAVFPEDHRIAIAALALNAFIPMFVFISASVNNDNLVVFLASLTLVLLVRLIQRGATRSRLLLTGVIIGLGCLAKLSALGLIPLAGLVLGIMHFAPGTPVAQASGLRREDGAQAGGLCYAPVAQAPGLRRLDRTQAGGLCYILCRWIVDYAVLLLPVVLIAGWWYVRNWHLYGDPTGLSAMLDIVGRRPVRPSLFELWGEFEGLRINFWGLFGVVNVLLQPIWIYRIFDALTVVAMIGVPLWAWRRWRSGRPAPWRELGLLSVWMLIEFIALLRWTSETFASQGRLFFPAIAPACLFLALGLLAWFPARWQGRVAGGLAAFFFVLSASAPFTSILPAYARPPVLTPEQIPATARPFDVTYGDVARLVAFEVGTDVVRPGEMVPVTLYWQALRPTDEDLSIFVQLVADRDRILGQVDSYGGGGAYPTSMWSAGEVIPDQYMVPVDRPADGPVAAYLIAGLYRYKTGVRLPAVDPAGRTVGMPILTRVKIAAPTRPSVPQYPLHANLDGKVYLVGYDRSADPVRPGDAITLTLHWQVVEALDRDYTVFIHLLDADDDLINDGDGPPFDNWYPTSFWAAGEYLADGHRLVVPADVGPGRYRIAVGLYEPGSNRRLPVLDSQGNTVADRILLGEVEVGTR